MKSIRKMLLIILMIIGAFTLSAAIMSVDAAEPKQRKGVYILETNWRYDIKCIYGYAYYSAGNQLAPLFNLSNSKPMTCEVWKLTYEAQKINQREETR